MQLLASVNAGFAGAALGHVELYVRDTSTRATWYSSFEGDGANSTGSNITLDAYGSALIYVNQLVDVVVKDVDGVTVRSYGDGYAAPNIEVISPAFTGVDYVTAASAVSEPTTLQAILNLWVTNAGAPDWKVLIGGVATTLSNALGAVSGLFFNVKSPAYGAVGDGVTSDQAAIVAAHAAAVAAGGGIVFFPAGTYRLTTTLTWDQRVAMTGVGPNLSTIAMDAAGTSTLLFSSAFTGTNVVRIRGLSFSALQTNSAVIINCTALAVLDIEECVFAPTALHTGRHITYAAGGSLFVSRCVLNMRASNPSISDDHAASLTVCRIIDNHFYTPATFNGHMVKLRGQLWIEGNNFDASTNLTSGTFNTLEIGTTAGNKIFVRGNKFLTSGVQAVGVNVTGGVVLCASDNAFDAAITAKYAVSTVLADGSCVELPFTSASATAGSLTSSIILSSSSTSAITIELPRILHVGQHCDVIVYNASGSNWGSSCGFTYSGGTVKTAASLLALNTLTYGSVRFVAHSSVLWVQEGAAVEDM